MYIVSTVGHLPPSPECFEYILNFPVIYYSLINKSVIKLLCSTLLNIIYIFFNITRFWSPVWPSTSHYSSFLNLPHVRASYIRPTDRGLVTTLVSETWTPYAWDLLPVFVVNTYLPDKMVDAFAGKWKTVESKNFDALLDAMSKSGFILFILHVLWLFKKLNTWNPC